MMSHKVRRYLIWGTLLFLILFIFCFGLFKKQKVWSSLPVTYPLGSSSVTAEKNGFGIMAKTDTYHLPSGTYTLQWQMEGDGTGAIRFYDDNDVEIQPSSIDIPNPGWGSATFTFDNAVQNFYIAVEFCSGNALTLWNLRLASPFYSDDQFSFSFILLVAGFIIWLWMDGNLNRDGLQVIFFLFIIWIFVSIPGFREDNMSGSDTNYHVARILNLADELASGQLPGRLGGYSYNGYGAMTSVFYPDLFIYPSALLILAGVSDAYAVSFYLLFVNLLTIICAFYAAKKIFKNTNAALCVTAVYTCADLRLFQAYYWPMFGSVAGIAVFPIFLLGLWYVLFDDKSKWPMLVLGAVLIYFNHMITTLLCLVFAIALGIISLPRIIKEKRWIPILQSVGLSALICLTDIIPLIMLRAKGITTMPDPWLPQNTALEVSSLLSSPRYIGIGILIFIALYLWHMNESGTEGQTEKAVLLWFLLACAGTAATTKFFPWSYLSKLTFGISDIIQFPMRLLTITVPLFAFCGGYAFSCILKNQKNSAVFALVILMLSGASNIQDLAARKGSFEFGTTTSPVLNYQEYLFDGTKTKETVSRQILKTGEIEITDYTKTGSTISAKITAQSDGSVSFPLFAFPCLEVTLDGQKVPYYRGKNNRVTIDVNIGSEKQLHVRYKAPVIWKAADCISLSGAVLLILLLRRRMRKMKDHP